MKQFRILLLTLAVLLTLTISSIIFIRLPTATRAQVRPTYSMGAMGLGQLLRRLQTTASALHTGAHPDDEDSALIARLARGDSARVAYLSLNRGEGGQNVIGTELFEALGVIRTEELLQARRLDGGSQLFTRTFDYGFSKTRAEAATKWGERNVLADMVRAIRLYRPLVIISRFTGTPADGHGQHQLAGYLTPIAFRLAADPAEFPEQIREGLRPWQALKLYVSEGFRRDDPSNRPTLFVETGRYDALLGRSYFEIAMEGRSQHKSQEMGTIELRGEQRSGVRLLESNVIRTNSEGEQNIFDNIDTSIRGIARLAGLRDDAINDQLAQMERAAALSLRNFNAYAPHEIIEPLSEGLQATRQARTRLARVSDEAARVNADFLLAQKERDFTEALQRAAGVVVDALADTDTIAPGESFTVTVRSFYPDAERVRAGAVELLAPEGWRVEPIDAPPAAPESPFRRRETARETNYFRVTAAPDAPITQPYWLRGQRTGDIFQWPTGTPHNAPFEGSLLTAATAMRIGETTINIIQAVEHRYADIVRGELRREVGVVPALTIEPELDLLVFPIVNRTQTRRFTVRIMSNSPQPMSGRARLTLPAEWRAQPAEGQFELNRKGERASLVFNIVAPDSARAGSYTIGAEAVVNNRTFNLAQRMISYPHIQTHRLYRPARTEVRVMPLRVAPVRVGYIIGSGDRVPEAIRQMGLDVTLLDENDLAIGDLTRFDTIVVGIRASEARADFVANHNRIMDYVRGGGTLIVQYQQRDYVDRNLAPFPAQMPARVTDERAPVRILEPSHPAFNFPNRITAADFDGWVQERSLYNFSTFDPRYTPLLESHDPGEAEGRGGELYAEIGRGHYIYTSYAWFRQLPAGVPGAYRMFANLLSLPRAGRAIEVDAPLPRGRATRRRGSE